MDMNTPMTDFNAQRAQFDAEAYRKRIDGLFVALWHPADTAPYEKPVLAWWKPIDNNPYAETAVVAQRCLVTKPHEDEGQGEYKEECWWANGRYYDPNHITHWMPLPSKPNN